MKTLALALALTLGQWGPDSVDTIQQNSLQQTLVWDAPSAPSASAVSADTLVLWHMDESSGVPVDSVGYDGGVTSTAFYGTVQASVGVFDGSRYFSGNTSSGSASGVCTSGNIPIGILGALLTGNYTWSAWLYRGVSPATQAYENPIILSDGAVNYGVSFGLSVNNSTNKMEFYWKTGSSSYESHASTASLSTGGWHHVAATVEVTGGGATRTVNIYLDGTLDSTFTGWVKPYTGITTNVAYIGCAESGYYAWAGSIDEMALTTRALSAAEVLALYRKSGRWSSPPSLAVGPTITYTRASTATYESSAGHVVNALSGEMRCGYLGCLVEPQRTNSITQSAALNTWSTTASGVSAPSVSANSGAAQDGTFTADAVTFASVGSSQYSIIGQSGFTMGSSGATFSVYGRTASGSVSAYLYAYDTTSGVYISNTLCTWTTAGSYCSLSFTGTAGHSFNVWIGADCSPGSGMSPTTGGTVYLSQGQLEEGLWRSSHIPTGATAVTRAADVAYVPTSVTADDSLTTLLVNGSAFNSGGWTSNGATASYDGTLSPSGAAAGLLSSTGSGASSIYQVAGSGGGVKLYGASAWGLPSTSTTLSTSVYCNGGVPSYCACSSTSGTCATSSALGECTVTVTGVSGWTEIDSVAACPASTTTVALALSPWNFTAASGKTAYFASARLSPYAWAPEVSAYLEFYAPWNSATVSGTPTLMSTNVSGKWAVYEDTNALKGVLSSSTSTLSSLAWNSSTVLRSVDWEYSTYANQRLLKSGSSVTGTATAPTSGSIIYLGGPSTDTAGLGLKKVRICKGFGDCR